MSDVWDFRIRKMDIAFEMAREGPLSMMAVDMDTRRLINLRIALMKVAKQALDEMYPEPQEPEQPDYVPRSKQIMDD